MFNLFCKSETDILYATIKSNTSNNNIYIRISNRLKPINVALQIQVRLIHVYV